MLGLKGGTSVREPVNKDTGCVEGGGGQGADQGQRLLKQIYDVCSLSKTYTRTYAYDILEHRLCFLFLLLVPIICIYTVLTVHMKNQLVIY